MINSTPEMRQSIVETFFDHTSISVPHSVPLSETLGMNKCQKLTLKAINELPDQNEKKSLLQIALHSQSYDQLPQEQTYAQLGESLVNYLERIQSDYTGIAREGIEKKISALKALTDVCNDKLKDYEAIQSKTQDILQDMLNHKPTTFLEKTFLEKTIDILSLGNQKQILELTLKAIKKLPDQDEKKSLLQTAIQSQSHDQLPQEQKNVTYLEQRQEQEERKGQSHKR